MSNITFQNSEGLVRSFTDLELDRILTDLNAANAYFTSSTNDLLFIRLADGYLLLFDRKPNTNRRLFEMFSFGFAADNPHQLKLVQNNSATEWTLDQALLSVGYAGIVPVQSLEQVFLSIYVKSGSNVDTYSKTETDALLSVKQNQITDGSLSISKINGLQSELDTRALSSAVYSKTEIQSLISNLIDNADTNLDTLNEIANAINNDPLFYEKVASIQGLETLVRPSDSSRIALPLQNSEGTFILSNDNQTFDLSFKPAGSQFSLTGLTYNNANGLTVNNDLSANSVSTSALVVSGLDVIDQLNNKASISALSNGLSQKVDTNTFNLAINQKADSSLVSAIIGLQTLVNDNQETILPIESNGSSTRFRFRVGNNSLKIEKFDNTGTIVIDDWLTVLTLSLDDLNLPVLMLGDLNVKSELASKASVAYVDSAIANVQPVSGGSSVLTNYVSPLEASLDGLDQYSLYRSGKTMRLQVKPPTQYGIRLSSSSSVTWSNVALVPDNSWTFETWVYSDRAGGAPTLLDVRGNGKAITVNKDGGGRLQVLSNDANLGLNVNGYVPPAGQWIHLAVQNDLPNNIFRVYVNGDSTLLNPAPGISGWSSVSSVSVSVAMSEGYNIFSNIRLSLGAVYGISTFITKSLPLDKNNSTKFLVQGNTTNDIVQNVQGALLGSVVLEQLSDALITETATDGDIQVVKVTANDVRTNNLGVLKKTDNSNLFSVIDQTTLGGVTLDPVIVAGVPMVCGDVTCTSLTVAGVPVTGGGGGGGASLDSAMLSLLGISALPRTTDVIGLYVPSSISSSGWHDLYGSNNTLALGSAWALNKNWQYLNHNALDTEGIELNTTGFMSSVKAVVIVYNWNSTIVKNNMVFCDGTSNNFISPRTDGYTWDTAGGEVYYDGVQTNSSEFQSLPKEPAVASFSDKWTVLVLNKQRLSAWSPLLRFFAYPGYSDFSPPAGAKVACIGIYNQDLSAADIHDITHWGKSRFGNLV